ncbi:protein fem-1 homolog C-like [Limulus polyphemus]|uniref:Protein fem-1 homolog C-like n=1 Tax=Limulus polyphemus TaxID=6850 RepID=A0ABM1B1X6_LIMPO|nr:protein fem-1 homolog C-like [Limulus polyphemus]
MDYKIEIFTAARDGKLQRLKEILEQKPKEEITSLVTTRQNGATPLVMASRNGHLEVVEYLLEECKADIEQVGSVSFDGENIEGAPPLWSAAASGHLKVVKSLVEHGANVNSTTKTNSTPLRAACFDGHFEIVKFLVEKGANVEIANRHGHTCLMIACYKGHLKIAEYLIDGGAKVNRKSVKGNTALHDCAESGSLEIMKLLLQSGAKMDVDSYGMTPLLAAAVTGHPAVVEYLISLPLCSRQEKIDALELLGATYVDKKRDMMGALNLWRRAMEDRYCSDNKPLAKPFMPSPIAAYENATEIHNLTQLEELISDPDEMRMQALLVRERILGPAHPDTSYYIRYRGAVYADAGNFDRCINLWMYALDMQQMMLEPLSPMTQSSLQSFAELFSYMMSESWARQRSLPNISFSDLLCVFQKALLEVERAMNHMQKVPPAERDSTNFHRTLVISVHLIALMCRIQDHISYEQGLKFKQSVYRLVKLNPRGRNGWTPLHLACYRDSLSVGRYPVCSFPSIEVVNLLLEVGALPNTVDYDNNTPLHVTAMNKPFAHNIFKLLLQHGAHLDTRNLDNKTPLEMINNIGRLNVYPLRHLTLQCLAAQTIMKHKVPFKDVLRHNLAAYVEAH